MGYKSETLEKELYKKAEKEEGKPSQTLKEKGHKKGSKQENRSQCRMVLWRRRNPRKGQEEGEKE